MRAIDVSVITVNVTPLLDRPATVTTTGPVVAPEGTVTLRLVALALVTVAAVPLKVTASDAGVVEKFAPTIVTEAPAAPEVGDRLVMLGVGVARKTVAVVEPQIEPVHAVTVVVPVVRPSAKPRSPESLEMLATAVLEELHVTEARVCVPLSPKVPFAVRV